LALVQAVPQAPQLAVSLLRSVSQPLSGSPSQSAYVPVHVGTQAPLLHTVVPLAFVQAFPQLPQLAADVWVSVSQPSATPPLQSP
jgi:hypothetical protein